MPPAEIRDEAETCDVWDENEKAFRVFAACATQWRTSILTGWRSSRVVRHGLDYAAVDAVMRRLGVRDRSGTVFADVQLLEHFALEAFAEVS